MFCYINYRNSTKIAEWDTCQKCTEEKNDCNNVNAFYDVIRYTG